MLHFYFHMKELFFHKKEMNLRKVGLLNYLSKDKKQAIFKGLEQ
jgi:hypothetical protein